MSVRNVINYPNGGKLLIFNGSGNSKPKVKYIPSPAYEEARKKATSSPALSLRKKTASPFKNASDLIDRVFSDKTSHTSQSGKSTVVQAVNNLRTHTRVIRLNQEVTYSKVASR